MLYYLELALVGLVASLTQACISQITFGGIHPKNALLYTAELIVVCGLAYLVGSEQIAIFAAVSIALGNGASALWQFVVRPWLYFQNGTPANPAATYRGMLLECNTYGPDGRLHTRPPVPKHSRKA